MIRIKRRALVVMVATAATLGLTATVASAMMGPQTESGPAVLTPHSGTSVTNTQILTQNAAWGPVAPAAGTFVDVPGAAVSVTVPAGTSRVFDTSFTAESECGGTGGWCSVRVVMTFPSGATIELDPVAGTDFAFDSAGGDRWQSNAIGRVSPRVGAGTYRLRVQAARVSGATSIRLDDWTFKVQSIA